MMSSPNQQTTKQLREVYKYTMKPSQYAKLATSTTPKTCTRCGETEGEKLPKNSIIISCKKTSLASILLSITVLVGCMLIRRKNK